MYAKGTGVRQNYTEAFNWFSLAAEQGHTKAICNLAAMYASGVGTRKNIKKAKDLSLEAREAGEADCKSVSAKYIPAH
jgi:hypothetical protein